MEQSPTSAQNVAKPTAAPCPSRNMREHTRGRSPLDVHSGKAFMRQASLCGHLRTHSRERAYTCTQCQKAFCWPSSLRKHVRMHNEEKPYACQQCGKAFWYPTNLRGHTPGSNSEHQASGRDFTFTSDLECEQRPGAEPCEWDTVGKPSALHSFHTQKLMA